MINSNAIGFGFTVIKDRQCYSFNQGCFANISLAHHNYLSFIKFFLGVRKIIRKNGPLAHGCFRATRVVFELDYPVNLSCTKCDIFCISMGILSNLL